MVSGTNYRDVDLRLMLLNHLNRAFAGDDYFLASEARYGTADRRADVLVVAAATHAYEIKSDVDSLARLNEQILDYRKCFDYVTVVTTTKHLAVARELSSRSVGLMIEKGDALVPLRRAKLNKRLDRLSLVKLCSRRALLNITNQRGNIVMPELERLAATTLSLAHLRSLAMAELSRRHLSRFEAFTREASPPYREWDLSYLRSSVRLSEEGLLT